MAAQQPSGPEWEELLRKGAQEILRLNPHLADAAPTFTEEESRAILDEEAALDALWNSAEGQRAQQLGYSAAQAVDEDRGE